ncbi:hypothetical protein HDV05_005759 [Chytridiales sp. JEL 0842]|nr:hypothetical protein HDV05_005759 [Chytridiales sp. JEL 0842]
MMEKEKGTGFYVIDALALKQPAGKPFHLEQRLKSKRRRSNPHGSTLHSHDRSNHAFMEARRNKLANRNSHVRTVMFNHRKEAHASETDKKKKLAETMAAAEQKRATILDSQVKNYASKVAKAKQVAAAQQRKESEDSMSRRRALEDRLRASETRRRYLLTVPRSRLLDPTELAEVERVAVRADAARTIQRWYRNSTVAPLIKRWNTASLSVSKAEKMAFDKLVNVVQTKSVIHSAAGILGYLKTFVKTTDKKEVNWKNPSRVFLSAYIIIAHTSEIMPTMAVEEEAVKEAAIALMDKFESWLESDKAPAVTEALVAAWVAYYNSFETWKDRDTMKIVDGLVNHWIDLEKLWLSVKEQIDAQDQWRPQIEQQQLTILNRLKRFGEKAMDRLKSERRRVMAEMEAAEDSDDAMETVEGFSKFSMEETTPAEGRSRNGKRASDPSDDLLSTSPKKYPTKFMQMKRDSISNSSRSGSPSPSRGLSPFRLGNSRSSSPVTKMEDVKPSPEVEPRAQPASNNASNVSQLASAFGLPMSNEQLAHELTLDPEFSLKKPTLSPLEAQIRQVARKAFFDSVIESFNKGDFSHVPEFIEDMRKELLSMVSENGKIATDIKEKLDVDFIRHQIKHNSLNVQPLLAYIVQKMSQLCAPLRDQSIRALDASITSASKPADYVPIIDSILTILEDMKLDLANYRLQSLRPHLKEQAVTYEKARFTNAVARKEVTLERTKEWLAGAVKERAEVAKARNPEGVVIPENKVRFTDVFHDAILGLVFSNVAVNPSNVPETMMMDAARIYGFQNEGQRITIVAALLMLTQNGVPELRGDSSFLMGLKDTLTILLKEPENLTVENLAAQVIKSVSDALMTRRNKTLDDERKGLIKTMVEKTLSTKDPVFGLLRRRIQATIKAHVVNGTFKKEGLERSGLELVRTELENFSYRVAVWVKFNGEVFTEWYDEILTELDELWLQTIVALYDQGPIVEEVTAKITEVYHGAYPRGHPGTVESRNEALKVLVERFPDAKVEYLRYLIQTAKYDLINRVTNKILSDISKKGSEKAYPKRLKYEPLKRQDFFRSVSYVKGVRHRLYNKYPSHFKSTIKAIMAESNNDYVLSNLKMNEVRVPIWLLPFGEKRHPHYVPEIDLPEIIEDVEELQHVLAELMTKNDLTIAEELNRKQYIEENQMFQCGCCFDDEVVFENVSQCEDGHLFCKTCLTRLVTEGVFGQGQFRGGKAVKCMNQVGCDKAFSMQELQRCLPTDVFKAYERLYIESELERTNLQLINCPFCKYAEVVPNKDIPDILQVISEYMSNKLEEVRDFCQNLPIQEHILFVSILFFVEISFTMFIVSPLLAIAIVTTVIYVAKSIGLWDRLIDHIQNFAVTRGFIDEADRIAVARPLRKRRNRRKLVPFQCQNPECGKGSCTKCQKEWPQGSLHVCHEKEQNSLRLYIEQSMSEALIRTCPGCSLRKKSGCNKMVCPKCSYAMCYVCRSEITREGYSHFCDHFRAIPSTKCTQCQKCDLYQLEDDNLVTRRAAEKATAEWIAQHPDASKLKLDLSDIGPLTSN